MSSTQTMQFFGSSVANAKSFPNDTVIIIANMKGTGEKFAYNVLKKFPDFRVITEKDVERTIQRMEVEHRIDPPGQSSIIVDIIKRQQRRKIPSIVVCPDLDFGKLLTEGETHWDNHILFMSVHYGEKWAMYMEATSKDMNEFVNKLQKEALDYCAQ